MSTETFTVLALPRAWVDGVGAHVSLFIAPRLAPDGGSGKLSEFAVFPDWIGALQSPDAVITLRNQTGDLAASPRLTVLDGGLWAALFPPDTPVVGYTAPDFSQREWRSFDPGAAQELGRALLIQAVLQSPTAPPPASALATTRYMNRLMPRTEGHDPHYTAEELDEIRHMHELELIEQMRGDNENVRRSFPDEAALTGRFDARLSGTLRDQEKTVASAPAFERGLLNLHRVRRYYERPESQQTYQKEPDAAPKLLDPPSQEFHERVSMTGDHPELMQMLGLVIDLDVDDLAGLAASTHLTAAISVPGLPPEACRSPRVLVKAARDGALVTVPASTQWRGGALALGETAQFTVLDLEADGTALKSERYLWGLPRMDAIESNGAPGTAAPPALRASGFSIARRTRAIETQDRMARQHAMGTALDTGVGVDALPPLASEDVARGFRVEVWDQAANKWFSVHSRRTVLEVFGHEPVTIAGTSGFVQGTTAHETPGVATSPVHVHESLFGWEGWSLSAPRPGAAIRNRLEGAGFEEVPDRAPADFADGRADATHVLAAAHTVAQGTLPVLRFGREYAFRAWLVDLAGNSRVHPFVPPPTIGDDLRRIAADPRLVRDTAKRAQTTGFAQLGPTGTVVRRDTEKALTRALAPAPTAPPTGTSTTLHQLLPDAVADEVARRIATRRLSRDVRADLRADTARASRTALVTRALQQSFLDRESRSLYAPLAEANLNAYIALLGQHAGTAPKVTPATVAEALKTVTELRRYLRWDPAGPPAVVPTGRYSEGESLRVLVIRSGVDQDPDTLEVTVTSPADYAAAAAAAHPELSLAFVGRSRRHLAPPKTSQLQAEQHGCFDDIVTGPGGTTKALAAALRENGAFTDLTIADLDVPRKRNDVIPPPHIEAAPGVVPVTLPLPRPGDPLPSGQYLVNPAERLPLPYLPDPIVRGVSLAFPEAGADRTLSPPFDHETFTTDYDVGDGWPDLKTIPLALASGATLGATASGVGIEIRLPAGDTQTFRLASALVREQLPNLGVWRSLHPTGTADRTLVEAAADGLLWALSPSDDVLLVHAVPRPIDPPRPTLLWPGRAPGSTSVTISGGLDVHGPSTEQITMRASWTDVVDDAASPTGIAELPARGLAFTTSVRPDEDIAVLAAFDSSVEIPYLGRLSTHRAVHEFGDTKHRRVTYRAEASTRFREYFPAELLAGPAGVEPGTTVGDSVELSVPSSARPAPPIVHSVIPLFRWSHSHPDIPAAPGEEVDERLLTVEPEHPMAVRHTRRAGVRIYLERPWFSSGEGELLGLLFAVNANDAAPPAPPGPLPDGPDLDGSGYPFVSKWGQDPIWTGNTVAVRALALIDVQEFLPLLGVDDRNRAGRPVTAPRVLPLPATGKTPGRDVIAIGYRPQFSEARGLWYVDVAVEPRNAFWPFVRLAVARFQPESIDGAHLSEPVRADFVQLPPERITTVSRPDNTHVRVIVSGTSSARHQPDEVPRVDENRFLVARLQQADPALPSDLGWRNRAIMQLSRVGQGEVAAQHAWAAEITSPESIPLTTPASVPSTWRVLIEEWERFAGDPEGDPNSDGPPRWEQRLVFADEVPL